MTTREVVLDGGSPWGFRMHGGADVNQPLRISRVNPGSKAAVKGIREGDLITSISGQNTKGISNSEAHSLLKNAGDSLILGLNEDVSGSPKRRHYNKTIHQETHSETVKKSSITYSIQSSESITSKPETNNEKIANLHNEKNKQQVNGKSSEIQRPKLGTNGFSTDSTSTLTDRDTVRNNSSDFAIASQRSSYTNCTPSPSTASTLTEDGIEARSAMADNNASSSRSRRRRARNNRKKNKNKQCEAMAVDETNCDGKVVETETTTVETKHEVRKKVNYRVDSPEEIEHVVSSKDVTKQTSIIKSKSLDHDEMIRIQELSDASEGENKGDNPAIISEASESEFEWEETDQLDIPQAESGALSSMSLPLEHYHLEEVNLISPEDELKLRNFLEGLNLVNSPEESAKQTYEISTVESIKARKAQKRAALEQYFLPMVNNPRYLDVISEEASDQSDKEVPLIKHHLKQGTPELENPKDDRPPVPVRRHRRQINKSNYQLPNPAILVGTKIVDTEPVISSTIESEPAVTGVQNIMLPETSKVEVVYLSSSESPEALSDNEEEPSSTTCSAESLTSEDSKCDVRPNQNEQLQHNADIITQFTPPPTPENSPKSQGDNTLLNFAENVTMKLKHEDNFSYLQEVAKDERFNLLPDDLKVKVQGALSLPQGALSSHQCTLSSDKPLIPDILSVQSYEEDILRDDVKTPTKNLSVDVKYTNVISPPVPSRSPTPSSEASLSTAKYNPMNSSVGDMSTFTKDDEQTKEIELLQPLTLRESCLKYLISLPFGEAVLEELANVSQSIESFTSRLPSSLLPKVAPNLPAYVYNKQMKDNNSDSSDFPVNSNNQEMPVSNKWVGLPTERDPNVVVYLSPTQRTQLEKSKKVPDEAGKLLDLHEKYLSRKSCDEVKSVDENVKITTINKSNCNISINPPNPPSHRLLAIIREEPSVESLSGESRDSDFLHFKEINPRERVQSATLPRNKFKEPAVLESARLKARDLSEWLQLARHKSMSESNLSSATELKCESPHVSTNNRVHSENNFHSMRRRTSLPQEIFDRQMQYLLEKERDVQRELERLEEEKMKLTTAMVPPREFHPDDYHISRRGDYAVHNENKTRPTSMPAMPTEFFRQQMYEEYMNQIAERQERKQLKVIKMSTSKPNLFENPDASLGEVLHIRGLEEEFMDKVKERKGGASELKEDSVEPPANDSQEEDETPVLVIEGESLKDTKQLPKHLQEFVTITKQASAEVPKGGRTYICTKRCCKEARRVHRALSRNRAYTNASLLHEIDAALVLAKGFLLAKGIWSPGQRQPEPTREERTRKLDENETIPPVWTPKSANSSPIVERKEFKPVSFNSPVLSRKSRTGSESAGTPDSANSEPPWKVPEAGKALSTSLEKRLPISQSLTSGFSEFTSTRLPRAQNPTITLLQKAREGQLPRGAHYINQDQGRRLQNERPAGVNPVYTIKNEYVSDSESERPRKIVTLGPRQFQGIGPITKDGMPLILRSEVRDSDQSKWYKKMYDTIHKQKPHQGEYVTVRYKQRRAQYPYSSSGYLSEPEPGAYDSDFTEYKYATLDRRRTPYKERDHDYVTSATMPRVLPNKSSSSTDILRNGKDKPGRIEHYTPGHSSIAEKEAKEWWDEVMDIFDGHLDHQKKVPPPPKSFINQALKESGYESDSTLVFRRKEETAQQLSPQDHKEAYKAIQRGEDVPFHGLRKPAPERPQEAEPPIPPPKGQYLARSQSQESPRKYVENEVTIHYKTPVRQEIKEYLSEDELAHKQAEAMKKIYEEERRRKYLQELQDMSSRRHTDNFIPSEKSPIALNRYDDFDLTPAPKAKQRSPEPRLVAKALYNFVGQTARELTFRKGDLIYVRRQVDKNWYEGELNAMVGLFPVNHVEIVTHDGTKSTARKSYEGQARAKFNFVAQTHLELSLAKGELVIITRKVDNNWYEGKIGGRKGIFPMSYVDVLIDPQEPPPPSSKPVASPASHSILLNGSSGGKDSMGSHSYTPTMASKDLTATTYQAKPIQITGSGTYGSLNRYLKNPIDQALHIETQAEPVPYRALYKYAPQNDDELELMEGDTVFVLEKCDDGWYVGSSDRTGAFGTFPGNYVEKI